MGCGSSKERTLAGVLPENLLIIAPLPLTQHPQTSRLYLSCKLRDQIYWYFESGLTVPAVSPTRQVKIFELFPNKFAWEKNNYKINVPQLLKIADACKGTNRVFLTVDVLSLNGRALHRHFPPEVVLLNQEMLLFFLHLQ